MLTITFFYREDGVRRPGNGCKINFIHIHETLFICWATSRTSKFEESDNITLIEIIFKKSK